MCEEWKINKIIEIEIAEEEEGKNLHFNSEARQFIERKNERQESGFNAMYVSITRRERKFVQGVENLNFCKISGVGH